MPRGSLRKHAFLLLQHESAVLAQQIHAVAEEMRAFVENHGA